MSWLHEPCPIVDSPQGSGRIDFLIRCGLLSNGPVTASIVWAFDAWLKALLRVDDLPAESTLRTNRNAKLGHGISSIHSRAEFHGLPMLVGSSNRFFSVT